MFFLDLQTLRAGDEGWLVLDVTTASDRWLLSRNKDLGLRLYVETEDGKAQGCAAGLLLGAPPHCWHRASGSPLIWPWRPGLAQPRGWGDNPLPTLGAQRGAEGEVPTAGGPLPQRSPSFPFAEPTFQSLRGSPHCPSPRAAVYVGRFHTGQGRGEMVTPSDSDQRGRPGFESQLGNTLTQ